MPNKKFISIGKYLGAKYSIKGERGNIYTSVTFNGKEITNDFATPEAAKKWVFKTIDRLTGRDLDESSKGHQKQGSTMNLIREANEKINNDAELEIIYQDLTEGLYNEGVTVNDELVDYFKKVQAAIKQKVKLNAAYIGAFFSGMVVLGQPEAAEVITPADLKQAGVTANVQNPAALREVGKNKSVRDSVVKIGQTYGRQKSSQYTELVKQALSSGDLGPITKVMKEIIASHKRRTVGIKKKINQERQPEGTSDEGTFK